MANQLGYQTKRAIKKYKRKYRYWRDTEKLRNLIIYCSFILFVIFAFTHASLTPLEIERLTNKVEMFFQQPFNNIFSEQSSPPATLPPTNNDTIKVSYQTRFTIYNVEQKNGRILLYGATEP